MLSFVNKVLIRSLIKVSGNYFVQYLLNCNVSISHYLMGVGAGDTPESSGEVVIINKLKQLARSSCCIFDVGSNKGQFANFVLRHMNNMVIYYVHCFEPSSNAYEILSKNLQNNKHIILNNTGLGDKVERVALYYDEAGSGLSSLTKRKLDHFAIHFHKSEIVNIDTVDSYCLNNNIQYIDLLKIDAEGHELNVLMGAQEMFKNNAIGLVSFEFGGCNIDSKTFFQDFYYFFEENNMSIYRITPSEYIYPIPTYKEIYEQFRTTNFLAIRNSLQR